MSVRVAIAVSGWLALVASGCVSEPVEKAPVAPAGEVVESPAAPMAGAHRSNRRVFDGCDPAREIRRYQGLAGEDVLITFAWQKMGAAADLKAPARVLRIDAKSVVVSFDTRVPNLELYTSVWALSRHIQPNADGSFAVDPCSATFEPGGW